MNWHQKDIEEVFYELHSSSQGITEQEARSRLERFGLNILQEKEKKTLFMIFLDQFRDFMILVLIVFYRQATQRMDAQRRSGKPFFAYIPTNAPHGPYTARPEDAALYEGKVPTPQLAHFFGMIHNIDENIGRVLAKLKEWGIR